MIAAPWPLRWIRSDWMRFALGMRLLGVWTRILDVMRIRYLPDERDRHQTQRHLLRQKDLLFILLFQLTTFFPFRIYDFTDNLLDATVHSLTAKEVSFSFLFFFLRLWMCVRGCEWKEVLSHGDVGRWYILWWDGTKDCDYVKVTSELGWCLANIGRSVGDCSAVAG